MASVRLATVLSLSLSAYAWPQLRNGSDLFGQAITAESILSDVSSRGLPVVDESVSMGTLPVPRLSKRDAFGTLLNAKRLPKDDAKRGLPVGDISPGLMTLPVVHVERPSLDRRGVEVRLDNRSDVAYYAQLNIGNPPQKVFAQLDTGSFELWVNPDCGRLALSDRQFCQAIGNYDPKKSSSSKASSLSTELRYGIGSAQVDYVLDDIVLPSSSQQMKQVQFGVAESSRDQFSGILGIGHGVGVNTGYKNFIDQLADQGVTKTKAYSVALGSKTDKAGVVVFGGIDQGKYSGTLAPLPLIPADKSPDGVARFWVTLNSIQHTAANGQTTALTSNTMPVFLDTGATLTLLPPKLADQMAQAVGASKADGNGFYIVDCDLASQNGTIDFNFEGVTIRVPYKEMIREIQTLPTSCYLGIMPSTSFTLLGDTFMRSAYVVFDISNNMTYMAPYANCGAKPQTIDTSTNITSIVGTCSAQSGNSSSQPGGEPTGTNNGNSKQKDKSSGVESIRKNWSSFGVLGTVTLAFALAV
ncbi:hypothetical protein QQS21_003735 [Conoideocrella luteorostrata]|uniref:Peptidase A1 domain-containing protein n=1 Tax=Conoideocrella luteorostrata TaxID=1105319 RepID=A0AAJ0CSV8_9HYPO|nr:hypothetical protein QQS21_003735 [Conoideocrella luteorostrata]